MNRVLKYFLITAFFSGCSCADLEYKLGACQRDKEKIQYSLDMCVESLNECLEER